MVLERVDSSFGCIASMDVWENKLIPKVVFFETLLEVDRSFIVKNVQFLLVAALCKTFMNAGLTTFHLGSCLILEGDHQDAVTVVIVNQD
jgi:hypothetical protein